MDLKSRVVTRLTNNPAIDTSPSYSPDGKKITFNSDRGGSQQIYVMDNDGRNQKRISNEGGTYAQEVSGGYFISGFTESFGQGLYDSWIIKVDDNGNEIYDHTFGGTLDDKMLGGTSSLDGDPVIVGFTESFGSGAEDMFFIKFDQGYQP